MAKKPKRQPDAARRAKLTIQRRTMYLLMAFGICSFLALFAKAYDLTINRHEEMQERASSQQTQSTTISASRGTIYDRNGDTLAISATADTIFLDPKMIQERADELDKARAEAMVEGVEAGESLPISGEEYKELIASELSRILDLDEQGILDKMEKTWSQYEVLKRQVEKEIGDQVRSFITDNVTGKRIQGIHLLSDAKRYYPHGALASHVLGFLNKDNVGSYGLEAVYESELEGTTGLVVTARDGNNQEIMFQYEQYYDAKDGNSLQLTIDSTIQHYLESGLEEMIARFDASNGAAGIVMDPNSGAILAMASSPNYDVNDPWSIYDSRLQAQLDELLSGGEDTEAQEEGTAGETAAEAGEETGGEDAAETDGGSGTAGASALQEAYNDLLGDLQMLQWRNKAVNDTYEPGSTFKILTLATALEEGTVNLNSTFNCTGSIKVDGWTIGCSKKAGHGVQTLTEAAGNSCNPAFINIGFSVGTDTFYDYMEAFGLFDPTGVDLNGDAVGVVASRDAFTTLDLASYSFGQNFTVTPLQMITAQAACINGGYLYTPYLVDKELDSNGNVISQHDATPVRQVISAETSATVRQILEYVVSDGTGKNGQVAGYRIGGKTGTADKRGTKDPVTNPQGDVVVSFLCFAPADDPQVIMLLTMDTPSRTTGTYVSGGNMVAPTASSIMSNILPYLGIAPQYTEEEMSSADATVPYVVGMTEEEAAAKLASYGFENYRTVGDGATVTDQTPLGGAIVPASAEIILYMGAEKSTELCTVPSLAGLSATQANTALTNAGLIMKTTGAGSSGARVISQSLAEGAQVAAGTVVTVQMGEKGSTAD